MHEPDFNEDFIQNINSNYSILKVFKFIDVMPISIGDPKIQFIISLLSRFHVRYLDCVD